MNSVFLYPGATFSNATFTGNTTFTGQGLFANGSAALPGIAWASEPSIGFFKEFAGYTSVKGKLTGPGGVALVANAFTSDTLIQATTTLGFVTKSLFTSPIDGQANLTNNQMTIGVGFDILTDAIFKIRTRAQTGYASIDCLGLLASGVAGANKTQTPVTSITVVNGIVTAVS